MSVDPCICAVFAVLYLSKARPFCIEDMAEFSVCVKKTVVTILSETWRESGKDSFEPINRSAVCDRGGRIMID